MIGEVVFSSADLTIFKERRLDYVLYSTSSRHDNIVPGEQDIPRAGHPTRAPYYNIESGTVASDFGTIKLGDWLVKVGRTTNITTGTVSLMWRKMPWKHYPATQEIEVEGLSDDFAHGGDSGSWVFDINGALCGMVFAAESVPKDWGKGFVTPIENIQEHVRQITKGGKLLLNSSLLRLRQLMDYCLVLIVGGLHILVRHY